MSVKVPRCEKRFGESCVEKVDSVDCTAAASFCSTAFNEPFGGEYTLRRSALVVAFYRLPILTHRPQTRITMIELVLGNQRILLVYMAVNMLSRYSKGASNIAMCYPIVACVVHYTLRSCTHRPPNVLQEHPRLPERQEDPAATRRGPSRARQLHLPVLDR